MPFYMCIHAFLILYTCIYSPGPFPFFESISCPTTNNYKLNGQRNILRCQFGAIKQHNESCPNRAFATLYCSELALYTVCESALYTVCESGSSRSTLICCTIVLEIKISIFTNNGLNFSMHTWFTVLCITVRAPVCPRHGEPVPRRGVPGLCRKQGQSELSRRHTAAQWTWGHSASLLQRQFL